MTRSEVTPTPLQVAGNIKLEVTNATLFINDPDVKSALRSSIAKMAVVIKNQVQVALHATRRLVGAVRRLGTGVRVNFVIAYAAGVNTDQKARLMANVSKTAMQLVIQTALKVQGVLQNITVLSISAFTLRPTTSSTTMAVSISASTSPGNHATAISAAQGGETSEVRIPFQIASDLGDWHGIALYFD